MLINLLKQYYNPKIYRVILKKQAKRKLFAKN